MSTGRDMHWLQTNVYIAAWLALPVTVVVALIQGRVGGNGIAPHKEAWPTKKILAYLLFLICFPLSLTPWVEYGTRIFCGFAAVGLFGSCPKRLGPSERPVPNTYLKTAYWPFPAFLAALKTQ